MMQFANRVVVPKHVLVRYLDGESVLLNLETEKYFGLDTAERACGSCFRLLPALMRPSPGYWKNSRWNPNFCAPISLNC